jgi:flagellar basal-body rod protein FlgC
MAAQMVRMNTVASNLANASTVSTKPEDAFRALRPVFEAEFSRMNEGLATANVEQVVMLDRQPEKQFRPDHPAADEQGFVYAAAVNTEEEMVEMVEASRQYQNTLETITTLRALMARTLQMGQ